MIGAFENNAVAAESLKTSIVSGGVGSCFLFVANLPKTWSNGELHRELWQIFGPIGLVHCRATRDSKRLPIAFLRFAQSILIEHLPQIYVGQRLVRIEYGRAEEDSASAALECMTLYFPIPVTVTVNTKYFAGNESELQLLFMRFGQVLEIAPILLGSGDEAIKVYRVTFASPQEAFWCFDALNRYPVEGVSVKISFQ